MTILRRSSFSLSFDYAANPTTIKFGMIASIFLWNTSSMISEDKLNCLVVSLVVQHPLDERSDIPGLKTLDQSLPWPRTSPCVQNIAAVAQNVIQTSKTSIRWRVIQLDPSLLWFSNKDLKIFSYKVYIIHQLLQIDRETHLTYAHAILSCA